jgi:hypothetical protein
MKRALVILALCASVGMPVVALGQPAPSTPSPELRSMMEKIHAEAKMAAYAALTPAHAASVTSIAAQVAAGTLDPRSAEKQIDALLTTDEQTSRPGGRTESDERHAQPRWKRPASARWAVAAARRPVWADPVDRRPACGDREPADPTADHRRQRRRRTSA